LPLAADGPGPRRDDRAAPGDTLPRSVRAGGDQRGRRAGDHGGSGARRPDPADRQPGALGRGDPAPGEAGRRGHLPGGGAGHGPDRARPPDRRGDDECQPLRSGPAPEAPGRRGGQRGGLMFRLDGRTALVTGASQGIGEGIARLLAKQGARVVLAARSQEKLEALAKEIDGSHPLVLDVSQPETFGEMLKSLPEDLGGIDVLVNNAGITADNLLARMSLEDWERVLRTN